MNARTCNGGCRRAALCCILMLNLIPLRGCRTIASNDPVGRFLDENPYEAKNFRYLHVTDLDVLRAVFGTSSPTVTDIAETLKSRFASAPGINEYADNLLKVEKERLRSMRQLLTELDQARGRGAVVCEYEWRDRKQTETGLLILKDNKVTKRIPFLVEDNQ